MTPVPSIAFFRVPKWAWSAIEQGLELGSAGSAKLVLAALCRIANDERSASFTKPINYVATVASLERRTVERRLPDLERLGIVAVTRHTLRSAHTYSLAALSRNDATLSPSVATARDPHAVALSKKVQEHSSDPPPEPNTAQPSSSGLREAFHEELFKP